MMGVRVKVTSTETGVSASAVAKVGVTSNVGGAPMVLVAEAVGNAVNVGCGVNVAVASGVSENSALTVRVMSGVGVGGVGESAASLVCVRFGVADSCGVGDGGITVSLGVSEKVGVGNGVGVSVAVGVSVGVSVGASTGSGVTDGSGVSVGVSDGVNVGVTVGVNVGVGVKVSVGV